MFNFDSYTTDKPNLLFYISIIAFILDIHGGGRLILSMNAKMLNRDTYGDLKLVS